MFTFTNPAGHEFRPGMIYLGRDPETGADIGMATEKGAIASARTGKGAAQIIPNLLRWHGNSLTIDPSGENAAATWESLEARGYKVAVLDPFQEAKVPARLRASCNLLAELDPDSLTIREDIRVVADGTIMRHDPKHGAWDGKKLELIAGLIAHVVSTAPPACRTLPDVAMLLNSSSRATAESEPSPLETLFLWMTQNPACGDLARTGGETGLASLRAEGGQGPTAAALADARSELDWIASRGMTDILGDSTFDLSELKTGKLAVFLVLPSDYLTEHGRFLRLFVRCAISAMTKGGKVDELHPSGKLNRPCLFMLDEFAALGHLEIIKKAAGLLPKNGIHLWPFLQDLGQLYSLYGQDAGGTFFGNADAHVFYGAADIGTLKHISERIGVYTHENLPPPFELVPYPAPPPLPKYTSFERWCNHVDPKRELDYKNAFSVWEWEHRKAMALNGARIENSNTRNSQLMGKPLLSPGQVADLIGKPDGHKVAKSMIVFGKAGAIFNLALGAYFDSPHVERLPPRPEPVNAGGWSDRMPWLKFR